MLGRRSGHDETTTGILQLPANRWHGQTMVIEVSTNLMNWAPLITNTLETGGLIFTDPTSTNFPARFYRARLR